MSAGTERLIPFLETEEYDRRRKAGWEHQLIDVREPYEVEMCGIGGQHIPMGEILDRIDEIRRDIPVVVHCRAGNRSIAVVQALTDRHGFTNLLDLRGGVMAFNEQVDGTMNCD